MTLDEDWLKDAQKLLEEHLKDSPSAIQPHDVLVSLVSIETLLLVQELKAKVEAMEASLEFNELRLRVKAAIEEDVQSAPASNYRRGTSSRQMTSCPDELRCKWRMLNSGSGRYWKCEHEVTSKVHPSGYCDQGCCR